MGYGRGMRMKIETDTAELLSGVRLGKTLASPISMIIKNSDWENWTEKMAYEKNKSKIEKITIPRPGHADLVGVTKYNFEDIMVHTEDFVVDEEDNYNYVEDLDIFLNNNLSFLDKKVIELYYIEGLKIDFIVKELNISRVRVMNIKKEFDNKFLKNK